MQVEGGGGVVGGWEGWGQGSQGVAREIEGLRVGGH